MLIVLLALLPPVLQLAVPVKLKLPPANAPPAPLKY
jgi:hypothetical protein